MSGTGIAGRGETPHGVPRRRRLTDERGVALPMALIALAILLSLMVAFARMAGTEPVVASNHLAQAQARALAESGIERALWALSNPTATGGIPASPATAASPYDGSVFMTLSTLGGFTVRVQPGPGGASNERIVTATGWNPTNLATDPHSKAVKKIQVTAMQIRSIDPPCALCVNGTVNVTGQSNIDARTGQCTGGSAPSGGVMSTVSITADTTAGHVTIYGPGNNTPNETVGTPTSPDAPASPTLSFGFKYTDDEIAAIKSIAKATGHYYQGAQTFNPGNPLPNGLVFVDTTTGNPLVLTTPTAEIGSAHVTGDLTWSGWLIVAGPVTIDNHVVLNGLIYAQDDVNYTASGGTGSTVTGAIVSENRQNTVSSNVSTSITGAANIIYDCQMVRNPTSPVNVSTNWSVLAGTYKEVEGRTP